MKNHNLFIFTTQKKFLKYDQSVRATCPLALTRMFADYMAQLAEDVKPEIA